MGAHFTDQDDVRRVKAAVADLDEDEWQYHSVGLRSGWTEKEDGQLKTRVVDGACIFLNRPGFPAGAGCALHQHAVFHGKEPHTLKPDVCWQLPIRRTYRTVELPDETSYLEVSITEYDRRGWGPGGHDLDWYCSGNPEAHVGREPVYRSNAARAARADGQGGVRRAGGAVRGAPEHRQGGPRARRAPAAAAAGAPRHARRPGGGTTARGALNRTRP